MNSRMWRLTGAIALVAAALLPAGTHAQSTDTASLIGAISDIQQAAMPGVTITARQVDTGLVRTTVTTDQGRYRLLALPPGDYEIIAELSGFSTGKRTGVKLTVGAEAVIDFTLQPGGLAEAVTVKADVPIVETTTSQTGGTLQREQLDFLPTISRDFRSFLILVPGTTSTSEGAAFLGARARSNLWQIDGVDNNSDSAGTQNITPQLDSIAEVQVQTANFKAEYGRAAGGVVNAVTRSGSNAYHGGAFLYYRDEDMRARSPFENPTAPKPPFQRMYTGGTMGGPIHRDKTHFFGSFERNDQDQNSDTTYDLPPSTSPFSAGTLAFLAQNGLSTSLFGAGGRQFFIRSSPVASTKATARVDHYLNSRHMLNFRYTFDDSSQAIGQLDTLFDYNASNNTTRNQLANINYKWILSDSALNEAYFQYNDYWFKFDNNAPSVPVVSVPGFSIGGSSNFPQGDDGFRLHLKDNFSWIRGNHQFKAGGEARYYRSSAYVRINFSGTYTFPSVAAFIAGTPSRYTITLGNPDIPLSSNIAAGFIQDDWRPFRSLTLNFGVRYDYTDAKIPELVPGVVVDLGNEFLPLKGREDPAISRDKNNVAPRFGFTWSPDPKQAIYGGTGLYYDQVILNNYVSTLFGAPRRITVAIDNPIFPYPASSLPTSPGAATSVSNYFDPTFETPYNWSTTIGYRRELMQDLGVDIAVIHNRGEQQQMQIQANPGRQGTASLTGANPARIVPTYGSILRTFSGGIIRYTGLQIDVRKRMSHRYQGGIAYTLSRGKDNSFNMISNIQDPYHPELSYGPSNNDVHHRLVGHAEVMLPFEIQVGTIMEARTNAPLNITAGGRDLNGDGLTGDWVNQVACINISCPSFAYSRNSVRQVTTEEANRLRALFGLAPIAGFERNPNYFNVDLTLRKTVRFGSHQIVVFGDGFNIFNFSQYTPPTTNITSNLFGSWTNIAQPRTFQVGAQYRF
jgi:outer membrane receptor protein involved in Fe transport